MNANSAFRVKHGINLGGFAGIFSGSVVPDDANTPNAANGSFYLRDNGFLYKRTSGNWSGYVSPEIRIPVLDENSDPVVFPKTTDILDENQSLISVPLTTNDQLPVLLEDGSSQIDLNIV